MAYGIEDVASAIRELCDCLSIGTPQWETGWTPTLTINGISTAITVHQAAFSYQIEGFVWCRALLSLAENSPASSGELKVHTLPDFPDPIGALQIMGIGNLWYWNSGTRFRTNLSPYGFNSPSGVGFVAEGGNQANRIGNVPSASNFLQNTFLSFDIQYQKAA